jgi:putative Ca2+/H+ antiporter (TMEM165/GDT1 family)
MFWRVFAKVFGVVFVAEIGDKTQLATVLFSAESGASRWAVFAGAASALAVAAAIGVLLGAQLERFVKPSTLKLVAGIGFIAIGVWTLATRSR